MKIKDLIEKLNKFDAELDVFAEEDSCCSVGYNPPTLVKGFYLPIENCDYAVSFSEENDFRGNKKLLAKEGLVLR